MKLNQNLIVQKYGGSSVANIERIQKIAQHIHSSLETPGTQLVIVVSAMGDQTDDLLAMAKQISPKPPKRELDMLLSVGERTTMALLSIALDVRGIRARSLTGSQVGIITDQSHGNARISKITAERIHAALGQGEVAIVAGFQGVSAETKEITTLGRGGSDLTAVALAASLNAGKCELYKDVPGILTCDPRIVAGARAIPSVSWDLMSEMAWCGSPVIHTRAVHVAKKYGVAIHVKSSFDLNAPGSVIYGEQSPMETPSIQSIVAKKKQSILTIDLSQISTPPADILIWLWDHGQTPLINAIEDAKSLKISLDTASFGDFFETFKITPSNQIDHVAIISVIGFGFLQSPEFMHKFYSATGNHKVFWSSISNQLFSLALPEPNCDEMIQKFHAILLD